MKFFKTPQKTTGLLLIAIALITAGALVNMIHFYRFKESANQVVRTQEIIHTTSEFFSAVQDMETSQRGYLLAGDESYLAPYQVGIQIANQQLEKLKALIQDSDRQDVLAKIDASFKIKSDELQRTIELVRDGKRNAAVALLRTDFGKESMDALRLHVRILREGEWGIYRDRDKIFQNQLRSRAWFLLGGSAVSLTTVLWMFALLRREIRVRRNHQEALVRSENKLRQHANELMVINKELEAFCYSVSHDLRSPLRGIEGFSKVISDKYAAVLDEEGKGYLDRVRNGVKRMGQLIDDLLNLSRITRAPLDIGPVNLTAQVRELAEDLHRSEPHRKVQWILPDEIWVAADARLLRIALENLLSNAWKYTSRLENATIEVGRKSPGSFFVKDNGAGFDMAYQDKLFVAFQRLHTQKEFPGVGIGLATVQRIIHRLGGRVWAEGAVDQGASFYFTLGETKP